MTSRFECAIEHAQNGAPCVVTVQGDIDLANAGDFETALERALGAGPTSIVVDFAALTFIDSSGLRVLASVSKEAESRGTTFELRNIPGHAQRVLDVTGLSGWFEGRAGA
jgi:anti-sigma B factor antagonist